MQAPESVKPQAGDQTAPVPAYFSHWLVLGAVLASLVFGARWWSGATTPSSTADPVVAATDTNVDGLPDAPAGDIAGVAASESPDATLPVASVASTPSAPPVTIDRDATPFEPGPIAVTPAAPDERPDPEIVLRNVDRLRAPAQVPYPRKTEAVAAAMPEGADVRSGVVILTLLIGPSGQVLDVDVLRSIDPALDASAVEAAWRWRFEPTVREGKPVAVVGNFSVPFPSG